MKKGILSALVFSLACVQALAQSERRISFSIGPELSFATGSFGNTHSVGTGGTAQLEFVLQDKLRGTATAGVIAYAGKSVSTQVTMPIRVGAKYFLTSGLYAGAQLGVTIRRNFAPYSGTAFAYSPLMLGYEFIAGTNKTIDATIKYDASSGHGGTIGALGLRLAYVF